MIQVQAPSPTKTRNDSIEHIQLDSFELAKYLLKYSVLDYRLQHPKVIAVSSGNNLKANSMLSPSSAATASSSGSMKYSHSRKASGSSVISVSSVSSANSNSSQGGSRNSLAKTKSPASAPNDPFKVLVNVDKSNSRLFPKFTEKLLPKLRNDLSSTRTFTDPQLRRMLDQFINSLDDLTIDRLDKDGRIENILILFITCASKTLIHIGSNNYQDISKEISNHTETFINYLITFVKKSALGFMSSSRSSLIHDLKKYLNSFEKNSRMEPKKTVLAEKPSHRRQSSSILSPTTSNSLRMSTSSASASRPSKSQASSINSANSSSLSSLAAASEPLAQTKTVRDDTITIDPGNEQILYICDMLEIPQDIIPDIIGKLAPYATDTSALNDFRKCKEDLFTDNHPGYHSGLFLSTEDYFVWSAQEVKKLDQDISTLKSRAPYLNDETQLSIDDLKVLDYTYVPPSPVKNFHNLALYLIEYEYNNNYVEKYRNQITTEYNPPFDFSSDAHNILRLVEMFWRLSPTTMGVIMLLEAKRLKDGGLFSYEVLTDCVYPFIVSQYLEPNAANIESWTRYDKAVSYKSMSSVLKKCSPFLSKALLLITIPRLFQLSAD